jgi:hypothetical protein
MTVDCAILGRLLGEARNNFTLPDDLKLPNPPEDHPWKDVTNNDPRLDYDGSPKSLPTLTLTTSLDSVRMFSSLFPCLYPALCLPRLSTALSCRSR